MPQPGQILNNFVRLAPAFVWISLPSLQRTLGTVWDLPIGRWMQGPPVTILNGGLFQIMGALALQLETHAPGSRDWGPVGACMAPGTLGITDRVTKQLLNIQGS